MFYLNFYSLGMPDEPELLLGPFDGVQLTYRLLRETGKGETVAYMRDDEMWTVHTDFGGDGPPGTREETMNCGGCQVDADWPEGHEVDRHKETGYSDVLVLTQVSPEFFSGRNIIDRRVKVA